MAITITDDNDKLKKIRAELEEGFEALKLWANNDEDRFHKWLCKVIKQLDESMGII